MAKLTSVSDIRSDVGCSSLERDSIMLISRAGILWDLLILKCQNCLNLKKVKTLLNLTRNLFTHLLAIISLCPHVEGVHGNDYYFGDTRGALSTMTRCPKTDLPYPGEECEVLVSSLCPGKVICVHPVKHTNLPLHNKYLGFKHIQIRSYITNNM